MGQLVVGISNDKQGYTQFGGLRPFGVSFLIAGYDDINGYQLYRTDPSGNYGGWKAHAIGQNNNTADQILRQDWTEELDLKAALDLAAKVLVKTMDAATPNAEKVELATLSGTSLVSVRSSISTRKLSPPSWRMQPRRKRRRRRNP